MHQVAYCNHNCKPYYTSLDIHYRASLHRRALTHTHNYCELCAHRLWETDTSVIDPLRSILAAKTVSHTTRRSASVVTSATCLDAQKVDGKIVLPQDCPRDLLDPTQNLFDCVEITFVTFFYVAHHNASACKYF